MYLLTFRPADQAGYPGPTPETDGFSRFFWPPVFAPVGELLIGENQAGEALFGLAFFGEAPIDEAMADGSLEFDLLGS